MALALAVAALLQACGNDGTSTVPMAVAPPVTPPVTPPVSQTPTAAFTAPTTGAAHAPVAFDASASASTDGSVLQYFWNFGNGQRGGGRTIARVFAAGGAKNVTLTVVDGAGRTASLTRSITITDPPGATTAVMAQGLIRTLAGVALDAVTVSAVGTTAATSDAMGKVRLSVGSGVPLLLKLAKTGYADQFVALQLPGTAGADAYFEAVMRSRDTALTLADAAAGRALSGRDGARLTLPANSLVDSAGAAVTGPVQISLTPIDVTQNAAGGFPGGFDGLKADGLMTPIVSLGVVEYALTAGGQSLQLGSGKTATIEVPVYGTLKIDGSSVAAGATVPLWSLDETTGLWVQEGQGTLVDSSASPSGLAMRATVSHLSWWNADIGFDPYGPEPRCVYETNIGIPGAEDTFATATLCNVLAEFDRGKKPAAASLDAGQQASAVLSPRVVGYSRRAILPIAGGVTLPVPAGVNIALAASVLNGSWTGSLIVNGAVGVRAPVLINMRPTATTGAAPEAIVAPFDATRALNAGQVALFSFTGTTPRYARITASQAGSTLTGRLRLLRAGTALGTADFTTASGQIVALLPANDTYTVEVTALTNAPGAYRLQVELLGGLQTETLAMPFDVTKSVPAFTIYHGNFTIATPLTAWFTFRRENSSFGSTGSTQSSVFALPAAGTYTLELAPDGGQSAGTRVIAAPTSWQQVGPLLDGLSYNTSLIDLLADRNNKPVVGFTRALVVAGVNAGALLQLRRWTGTAWETVGSDFTIARPCTQGGASVSFAFDSNNDPLIAYGNTTTGSSTFYSVRRYSNGAWQALGANDGTLPVANNYGGACSDAAKLAPGPGGTLAIAYRADNDVVLQRWVGGAWVGIEGPTADVFAALGNDFALGGDATGRLYFVQTARYSGAAGTSGGVVRRLSTAAAPKWEFLGPNGGVLPQTNTVGLSYPRLRFDASASPVIGALAAVGSSVFSAGTAVYRYDGTQWRSTGGFQPDSSYAQSNADYLGFAVSGGEAFMSWINTRNSQSAPVVQKNTTAGWTPIGASVGGEIYLAVTHRDESGAPTPAYSLALLRKVAD